MIKELDSVVLSCDLPQYGLKRGDIGAVVHCYKSAEAFEVEFITGEGKNVAVVTLKIKDLRLMRDKEILHVRSLTITDDEGESDTQSYTITVSKANSSPQITSIPVTDADVNMPYTYDVEATDMDGDILTFELDMAPHAMSISSRTGLIQWTPGAFDTGDNEVRVMVRDPSGVFDIQQHNPFSARNVCMK